MKTLDIVEHPNGATGLVTETSWFQAGDKKVTTAAIHWFNPGKYNGLRFAWWQETEVTEVGNLANILTISMAHPFGNGGKEQSDLYKGDIS